MELAVKKLTMGSLVALLMILSFAMNVDAAGKKGDKMPEAENKWDLTYDDFSEFHEEGERIYINRNGAFYAERATHSAEGAKRDTYQGRLPESDTKTLFATLDAASSSQVKHKLRTGVPDEVLAKVSWTPSKTAQPSARRIEFQYWSTEPHLLVGPAKSIVSQIHGLRPQIWATKPQNKN